MKKYPESVANGLVFNKDGDILLIKNEKWKDKFTLPGGHVEIGEKLKETVSREIKKKLDMNVEVKDILNVQEFMLHPEYYERKHLLLFNFVCESDGSPKLIEREIVDYMWVRPEDAALLNLDPYSAEAIKSYIEQKKNSCNCKKHHEDEKIRA
ncbi:MAG: NUDIX domain-containing protein [Candidatus Aenigmarchaeota archaeon]|nr:NUDIX domain-containing protein [Candidatus Aenigmarchaeota archaeon]